MKAVWYDAKRLLLLLAPQSTVGDTTEIFFDEASDILIIKP